jgi:hypothetical protein
MKKALQTRNIESIIGMLDQFGGEVGITVQGNSKLYKTWFGTIGTLKIYGWGSLLLVPFRFICIESDTKIMGRG